MFEDNKQFQAFRTKLSEAGVSFRVLWEAKRSPRSRYADVAFLSFVGNGFSPKVGSAIVINYGKDGYGLYTGAKSDLTIDGDVSYIAQPRRATDGCSPQ
jgi:hypothetical protein